ncbi:MAG: glycosyltransferase [Bacteroidota bacterium]
MNVKRVLIIAYYWPPSGGSGVQRWLKFVKYLPQFGWKPYVFTPENPSFAIRDESLLKDVPPEAEIVRFPIWEPYSFFLSISRLMGRKHSAKPTDLVSGKNKSIIQSVSTWIRGNLFVPDPRVFWVRPSVKYLRKYLHDQQITTVITTGPPHSLHLIGYQLKKIDPTLRWLADFRDPWSEWGLLDSLMVGSLARKSHQRLENKILTAADEVITITPFYTRRFEALSKRNVRLLTNGFDTDDFKMLEYAKSERFMVRHVGIVNEKCDPRSLMEAVHQLIQENAQFARQVCVQFIGEVHADFKTYVESRDDLRQVTEFMGNIQHQQLMTLYGSSSLLVLVLTGYKDAEGYLPGKLFEYMATGLPIMAVGPVNGDAAMVLKETQAGEMIESHDIAAIKRVLLHEFIAWKNKNGSDAKNVKAEKYSRRHITQQLAHLLDRQDRP